MHARPTVAGAILLVGVFALCVYRAATQSFTIDESFTYLRYVDGPLRAVFTDYSANNHVLFSLLSRGVRWLLGRSELVLRIPTLLGCVLYLLASFRICRRALPDSWLQPLALLLMTANPLVLDFLVAARGYGLALGLSWWAVALVWEELDQPRKRLWLAGLAAGLGIAANLIFVIPLAALGLLALPLYARQGRFWEFIDSYGGPAVVLAFVLLAVPLASSSGQFYYGAATLGDTVDSLLRESLGNRGLGGYLTVGVLFAAACASAAWLLWRARAPQSILLGLVLGSIGVSVGCWVAMNRVAGVLYPLQRTGLYVLPLAGLGLVLSAAVARWWVLSMPLTAFAAAIGILYMSELRTGYFNEWPGEAKMRPLMRHLGSDAAGIAKDRPVTAGGTWFFEYSMRYYRHRLRLDWLKVLDANERKETAPDYYLLAPEDGKLIDELHLKVLEKDEFSGTVLARRN